MRKLQVGQLVLLKQLTNIRKVALTSELSMARAELNKRKLEIADLRRPIDCGATVEELAANDRWQKWKSQQIVILNNQYASMRATYNQAARLVGKAVAEDAVVDHLQDMLVAENKIKRSRQVELAAASHFLTHDVGDKDI